MAVNKKQEADAMASKNDKNKERIRNKISIAKPNFSLAVETDESLHRAREVFEDLMEKYRK